MKAIVQDKFGSPDDVLEIREIDKPVVRDDEVLVRVHAASIHIGDWYAMTGVPYLVRPVFSLSRAKNRVPGTDIAGTVEAVGKSVTQLDQVVRSLAGARALLPSMCLFPKTRWR